MRLARGFRPACLPALACAISCLAGAGPARADGDPASDILYSQPAFIPADGDVSASGQQELTEALREASRDGCSIRVALIASPADLGSDSELWRKPELYARFLGTELSLVYHDRLLIAMPDGFAVYDQGHPVAGEQRMLDRLHPGSGPGLARSTLTAIERLSAAAGHPLTILARSERGEVGAGGRSRFPLPASLLALAMIALAWGVSLWVRRPVWLRGLAAGSHRRAQSISRSSRREGTSPPPGG